MQSSEAMTIRYCSLGLGILFLLLGIAGFIPNLTTGPLSAFPGPGYGYVLGLFPTNYFHNAIGILVGLWGIAGFTSLGGAIAFNQAFAIIYAIQAIFGLFPFTKTLFGIMPLFGNNIWLSLLTAAIAYYFGFVKPGLLTKETGFSANLR
ncbi:DUF4383 domain-containing protein [Leptolyngbya sp. NK1-12]|uniref:DUF4383 domain-containing protein n=1 Tax=Leptolyngbya sp. NK1-12 TaxID=2547451 RepID=A0AA96WKA8_9CYAN|nr:DUF4383 domain-containing protein [Leptolyngbya sp. NK1-12]WNZ27487.1 DUF4383 domain-containing protein [Leptolyngbya sp. NK1-12]